MILPEPKVRASEHRFPLIGVNLKVGLTVSPASPIEHATGRRRPGEE
jgi:hypothetical protein